MQMRAAKNELLVTALILGGLLYGECSPYAALSIELSGKDRQSGKSGSAGQSHKAGHGAKAVPAILGKPASSSDDYDKSLLLKAESKDPLVRAKSIIREIESIEHPENHIQAGTPGWMEERNAAINSSQQRLQSCQARLAALGPVITPLLAENLTNTNHDVAQVSSTILGQFGESAVPSLLDVIRKSGPQPMAAAALKQIGIDALPPIVVMLQSSDPSESLAALTVLNSFLPDQNIGMTVRPISFRRARSFNYYNNNNSNDIILPLSTINLICHLSTKDKSVKYREQLVLLLGKIGPRAPIVPDTIITILTDDEQPIVREAAVRALGSVAVTQNEEALRKSVGVLLNTLKNDDFEGCRAEAATILGNLPNSIEPGSADIVVPALVVAFKDGYNEVSNAALQSLGNFGDKATPAVPTLIKYIQDKPASVEASNAMRALSRMKGASAQAMPLIVDSIQGQNLQLQLSAINAVENLGPIAAPAVKPLIAILSSTDNNLRYSAIRALGAIGPQASEAVPALREVSKTRNSERSMVRQALQKITGNDENTAESGQAVPQALQLVPPPAQTAPVTNVHIQGSSI